MGSSAPGIVNVIPSSSYPDLELGEPILLDAKIKKKGKKGKGKKKGKKNTGVDITAAE